MKSKLLSVLFVSLIFIIPFRLVSQTTCLAPTGLTTTNIALTGATLSWTASTGALAYMLQYRPVTTPVSGWVNVTTQTTSAALSNLTCGTTYEWQVAAYCGNTSGSISPYTTPITFTTLACTVPCLPPTGLITTNITLTGAQLTWIAPITAQGYVVQYRPVTNPVSSWVTINATTTSITLSNLSCGTNYQWQVATYCGPGTVILSTYSPPINFVTQPCTQPCPPPTGLATTSITLTGATLSWIAPAGALAYVVQYRPVTNPASAWVSVTTQTPSLTLSNLTCGTTYEWKVATHCGNTAGSVSAYSTPITFTTLVCVVPCLPPTGLTTNNITLTGATLSWLAPVGVYAYVVQYRPVTNPVSSWVTINATTTSITLSNLSCGTNYQWQVATYCGPGTVILSTYSPPINFVTQSCTQPCPPPTGLATTSITLTGATLSWIAPAGAFAYVVQYRPVTNPASSWITLTTQTPTLTLSNLTCGTSYEWKVAAHCGNNTGSISSYSTPITFTTLACVVPCLPPTGLTTNTITLTGATLSWLAPSGAYAYLVQYRPVTTPSSSWMTVTIQTPILILSNLACGTMYEWQVAAHCGNIAGAISPYSAPITFTTLACTVPCNPPTGLTTTNITLTGATLSWTAPTGALAYVVQYRPVTTPVSSWINVTTQTPSVTLSSLACGTTYEWRVASHCSPNTTPSSYSAIVTFTTLPCITPCPPPTGLTTTNITLTGATLSWLAQSGFYAYVVQYRPVTNPASSWITMTTQTPTLTLSNLSCGTVYEWKVAAHCGNISTSISIYSSIFSFSTLPCIITNCATPTGLTSMATNFNSSTRKLYWNSTNAVSYKIRYKKVNTTAYTFGTSTTNSKLISGLTSGQYEWQVQSICPSGSGLALVSAWSALAYFYIPLQPVIFPNPVLNKDIHVPIVIEKETNMAILISDQFGHTVMTLNKTMLPESETLDLDVANLKNGIYYIRITGTDVNLFQKIIIMR